MEALLQSNVSAVIRWVPQKIIVVLRCRPLVAIVEFKMLGFTLVEGRKHPRLPLDAKMLLLFSIILLLDSLCPHNWQARRYWVQLRRRCYSHRRARVSIWTRQQ